MVIADPDYDLEAGAQERSNGHRGTRGKAVPGYGPLCFTLRAFAGHSCRR